MPAYLTDAHNQKIAQRHLKKIQNANYSNHDDSSANAGPGLKKQKKLRSHVEGSIDWVFFLLISFAVLKDIYDIVSAGLLTEGSLSGGGSLLAAIGKELAITGTIAASGVAVAGIGAVPTSIIAALRLAIRAGIGVYQIIAAIKAGVDLAAATIAPFMFNLMFQWLSLVALLLTGGMFKRFVVRWKIIIAFAILEFIAESFLGLNWFPWATAYAILLYYIVLKGRRKSALKQMPLAQSEA